MDVRRERCEAMRQSARQSLPLIAASVKPVTAVKCVGRPCSGGQNLLTRRWVRLATSPRPCALDLAQKEHQVWLAQNSSS